MSEQQFHDLVGTIATFIGDRPLDDALEAAIKAQDVEGALILLAELVPEWERRMT